MSEKRNDYLRRLLHELRSLEERLVSVQNNDELPFSFFSESFNKTQEISRLLHELELLQIEEMKQQMKRLIQFLSESEQRNNPVQESEISNEQPISESALSPSKETAFQTAGNRYAEGVVLPEYKNPRSHETMLPPKQTATVSPQSDKDSKPVIPSLNDKIRVSPTVLDLRRSISLNDRFLFQRELFHNNREEMNQMMIRLNAFDDFDQVETYLREHSGWDFDDPVVEDFLKVIQKGFA
ncbi:hypothetical protein [Proteiniphilum sp. UBA1028]|jgi:hypothetical protein|uniref:hypothetical protein n=1 Tax=Proteiniphilum sp. UBA1028 TaxID=1947251 RepID=UPI0025DF9BBA|nr:hypothetical protein [Proteiniphilum sp. UBA1028]